MSRAEAWDDEPYPNACELFQGAVTNAVMGRRGQALLREIEEALLALPEKMLAEGVICENGMACTLASLEILRLTKRGMPRTKAVILLDLAAQHHGQSYEGDFDGDKMAHFLKKILGLKGHALPWTIMHKNDEIYYGCSDRRITPEKRWERMLAWVREQLLPTEATTS